MTSLTPREIASLYLHRSEGEVDRVLVPQIEHRLFLIDKWQIKPGEKVLEIGCGQGDCTITLAAALGENGHVTAVDPAPLDYGAPYTLGQSQDHLKASTLGSRITFVKADPTEFIRETKEDFTTAVLTHCIWYFASPSVLAEMLQALSTRVQRICIAEYNLTASDPRGVPHLISALTQATIESRDPTSTANIRTVLSPDAINELAIKAGLTLESRLAFTPNEGMLDGGWEVDAALDPGFLGRIHSLLGNDEREKAVAIAMRDSIVISKAALTEKGQKVKTMDVCALAYTTKKQSTPRAISTWVDAELDKELDDDAPFEARFFRSSQALTAGLLVMRQMEDLKQSDAAIEAIQRSTELMDEWATVFRSQFGVEPKARSISAMNPQGTIPKRRNAAKQTPT
ncbi:hypothetical protein EUX98_g5285 [Antrodiella citrinella]|uniref:Methyltransferase domain-containing protein n=1 Tax=Antrodiella citrinella TaxID=2447956 RepID=A0A4S4MUB5_9APHY|nr:hypothetical protein EUX98_g5285 [Antrodiella citrinella]